MNSINFPFETKNDTAPFSKISITDYQPAFGQYIENAKEEIKKIINNSEIPTFENTIEALEFSGEALDRISSVFFNLNAAETSDEMQKIAQEISPLLTEFSNDITLNEDLFKRIKSVYEQKKQFEFNS